MIPLSIFLLTVPPPDVVDGDVTYLAAVNQPLKPAGTGETPPTAMHTDTSHPMDQFMEKTGSRSYSKTRGPLQGHRNGTSKMAAAALQQHKDCSRSPSDAEDTVCPTWSAKEEVKFITPTIHSNRNSSGTGDF